MLNLTNEYRNINIRIFVQKLDRNGPFLKLGRMRPKKIFYKKKTDFSASFWKKVLYNILR